MNSQINKGAIAFSIAMALAGCNSGSSNPPNDNHIYPVANAGESGTFIQGMAVLLDGSDSYSDNGEIVAFSWKQVENGAPTLAIDNANTSAATVVLPATYGNQDYQFELEVTDNVNLSDSDTVEINGRMNAGIDVSSVSGNTTQVGSSAHFLVSMTGQPTADVHLSITSSDEGEGIPEESLITVSPDEWSSSQLVVVRGQNPDVIDGEQNYEITVSVSSEDEQYDKIDDITVPIKGLELTLDAPTENLNVTPGSLWSATLARHYTGSNQLTYSLDNAPEGMNIDLSRGIITWDVERQFEGTSFDIQASVNDGYLFTSVNFTINVLKPESVDTVIEDNTLTITDDSTSLNGLRISTQGTTRNSTINDLVVEMLPSTSAVVQPFNFTPFTDEMVIAEVFNQDVEIALDTSGLPAGTDLNRVRLFAYTTTMHNLTPEWLPIGWPSITGTETDPIITYSLPKLDGRYMIGITAPTSTQSKRSFEPYPSIIATGLSDFSCSRNGIIRRSWQNQTCTSSEGKVEIRGFGDYEDSTQWGDVTAAQLAKWVVDSQSHLDTLGMTYDNVAQVQVEHIPEKDNAITVGYVTSNDNFTTLHLNSNTLLSASQIRGTAAHEYHHHAQFRSTIPGATTTFQNSQGKWLTESTAVTFDERVTKERNYLRRGNQETLAKGINFTETSLEDYDRFPFFFMLERMCPNFDNYYVEMNNRPDNDYDATGLTQLVNSFDVMNCDFGDHFGDERRGDFSTALSYYLHASLYLNDFSMLLPDHLSHSLFSFTPTSVRYDQWHTLDDWLDESSDVSSSFLNDVPIYAGGGRAFEVPAIAGTLPEGKVAELVIESSASIDVSIVSENGSFISDSAIAGTPHVGFNTSESSSYVYNTTNNTIPKLFVSLVNASTESHAYVNAYFRIRDELDLSPIITSHENGDEINNRVVTVSGNIPSEGIETTDKMRISVNGLVNDYPLSNGRFSADLVMMMGINTVNVQGFTAGGLPSTNEEILLLNGVASSSTGRNALIPSRVAFVLSWDNLGDLDIYTTDKFDRTIWYSNMSDGTGSLDADNTYGYGPEVVTYRDEQNSVYQNGTFDVDVHYYSGSRANNYAVNVILNEMDGINRRSYQVDSRSPLFYSTSSENGPDGSGASRHNDILRVSCSGNSLCHLSNSISEADDTVTNVAEDEAPKRIAVDCETERELALNKTDNLNWSCTEDGAKVWF